MGRRIAVLAFGAVLYLLFSSVAVAQQSLTIRLEPQGGSGVSGAATLTDIGGGRTRVVINVTPAGNPNMPVHIHDGRCPNVGAIKFPLNNVMNGQSTTEVNATIAELLASPTAINLHRSPQEVQVFVSCGNIVAVAAPATLPRTGEAGVPTVLIVLLIAAGLALIAGGVAVQRLRGRA